MEFTSYFNDLPRDDVSSPDPPHALLVLPVHLAHLGLILLQRLNGVLSVPLLGEREAQRVHGEPRSEQDEIRGRV